jgi:DNA-binding transcriptional LysR family regulator
VLVPEVVARMAAEAPNAELVIVEAADDVMEQLDSPRADFLIGSALSAPPRLVQETLLTESLAWVVRQENPLPAGPISLEALLSVPHVLIASRQDQGRQAVTLRASWEDFGAFEAQLAQKGLKRRIGVTVPDTYSAFGVIRRSDMAALLPRKLAELSTRSGTMRLLEPPYESPLVDLGLLYLSDRIADPALAWMRGLLRQVAAEV